jgi:GT2 family glycosyltransferase
MQGKVCGYGLAFTNPELEVHWLRKSSKPGPAPILPGCCFATRRDVIEATGGWDQGLLQRGNVDNECGVRLWTRGYKLMATGETVVRHKFRKRSPYRVGWPEFMFNRLRIAFVHFNAERLGKVVSALTGYPGFAEALALLAGSDVAQRRHEIHASRKRTDDWYFARFGPHW